MALATFKINDLTVIAAELPAEIESSLATRGEQRVLVVNRDLSANELLRAVASYA